MGYLLPKTLCLISKMNSKLNVYLPFCQHSLPRTWLELSHEGRSVKLELYQPVSIVNQNRDFLVNRVISNRSGLLLFIKSSSLYSYSIPFSACKSNSNPHPKYACPKIQQNHPFSLVHKYLLFVCVCVYVFVYMMCSGIHKGIYGMGFNT